MAKKKNKSDGGYFIPASWSPIWDEYMKPGVYAAYRDAYGKMHVAPPDEAPPIKQNTCAICHELYNENGDYVCEECIDD